MKRFRIMMSAGMFALCAAIGPVARGGGAGAVLDDGAFKAAVERFNAQDDEAVKQAFPNAAAWSMLEGNVPLLDCPDPAIQRAYAFRWWVYRKHLERTPQGWVVTEFLPKVGWAGKYNSISCAAGHHLYEGRWIRDPQYLDSDTRFWLGEGRRGLHRYSNWLADAVWARRCVTGDVKLGTELLPRLVESFDAWTKEKKEDCGLYWQTAGADGMEVALGGDGYRPTINSYMFGDAVAIAAMAHEAGDEPLARRFTGVAATIRGRVESDLWNPADSFFEVLRRDRAHKKPTQLAGVRELLGFVPWQFHLPEARFDVAWRQLLDPMGFDAPFGPTTAEQRSPHFAVRYSGHDCQWNGPSWPYATAQTLTAMANLLNDRPHNGVVDKQAYFHVLQIYARSHALRDRKLEVVGSPTPRPEPTAGELQTTDKQPWIDENLNPYTGQWLARAMHRARDSHNDRGKDYNHSTFCDLVITGLVGLRPRPDDTVEVNPLAPDDWDWFCLDNIPYHHHTLTIFWDRTGNRYHRGPGLHLLADGRPIATSPTLTRLAAKLP